MKKFAMFCVKYIRLVLRVRYRQRLWNALGTHLKDNVVAATRHNAQRVYPPPSQAGRANRITYAAPPCSSHSQQVQANTQAPQVQASTRTCCHRRQAKATAKAAAIARARAETPSDSSETDWDLLPPYEILRRLHGNNPDPTMEIADPDSEYD